MRPGLIMHEVTAENLAFAAQLGVTDLVVSGEGVAGETGFDLQKMRDVRSRVEAAGLRVAALHNVQTLSLRSAFRALRFTLWDEEAQALTTFRAANRRVA